MIKYLLLFILIPSICYARTTLEGVPENAVLTKSQQIEQKGNLRGLIGKFIQPVKNDYKDNSNRGTVKFNTKMITRRHHISQEIETIHQSRNYSKMKTIIEDDSIIKNVNFSQLKPHTNAITGKNITFIECNLVNVVIDPTWDITNSKSIHMRDRVQVIDGDTWQIREIEKDDIWKEVSRENLSDDLNPTP